MNSTLYNIPAPVMHICKTLCSTGFEAWLVGGAVRDLLMGRPAQDFDIASNAKPEDVLRLFPNSVAIGGHCGTVAINIDGKNYEVTPYRSEGTYTDGRHPDFVRFVTTIEEDLSRRDFTMNAIAYDPLSFNWCDPYNGRKDIENKILRCVGNPIDRFNEDGLRLLRAVRFVSILDFSLADETATAIEKSKSKLKSISSERIHDEWMKILSNSIKPSLAFELMWKYSLIDEIVPEILPTIGCTQNRWHKFDVWDHSMLVMDAIPADDPVLRLTGFFHDIGKPATKGVHPTTGDATFYNHEEVGADMTNSILQRLKFSNEERHRIVHHVRHHLIPYEEGWSAAAIRRWVRRVGKDNVKSLCTLGRADSDGKGTELGGGRKLIIDQLESRIDKMSIEHAIVTATSQLAINGNDVMSILNLKPGPTIGNILKDLLERVIENPELNTREALIEIITSDF